MCRHLPDRCICWTNLDGFTVWILNQKHILAPRLALASEGGPPRRVCLASHLSRQSLIDKAALGRRHRSGLLSSPCAERRWWMGTKCPPCLWTSHIGGAGMPRPSVPLWSPPTFLRGEKKINVPQCHFFRVSGYLLSPSHCPEFLELNFFLSLPTSVSLPTSLSLNLFFFFCFSHLCSRRCLAARMTIISSGKRF